MKFLYARSTTKQSTSKIPKDSFTNSFICTKEQGNPTVECTVKECYLEFHHPTNVTPTAVYFGHFLCVSAFQLGGLDYKDSMQVFCQSKYDKTISFKLLLLHLHFCDFSLLYTFSSIHLNTFYCCQLIQLQNPMMRAAIISNVQMREPAKNHTGNKNGNQIFWLLSFYFIQKSIFLDSSRAQVLR